MNKRMFDIAVRLFNDLFPDYKMSVVDDHHPAMVRIYEALEESAQPVPLYGRNHPGEPTMCSDCKVAIGGQHKLSCHRIGTVTAASDYMWDWDQPAETTRQIDIKGRGQEGG